MSLFTNTLDSHYKNLDKKKSQEELQQSNDLAKKELFLQNFTEVIKKVVLPIFEEFSSDANDLGYASDVKLSLGNKDNKAICLSLIPEKDVDFNITKDNESVFEIKADSENNMINLILNFNQRPDRPNKAGKRTKIFHETKSTNKLTKLTIERLLQNFLREALQTREHV